MSNYRKEVEGLLGKECIKKLSNYVKGGKMSEDELKYFVQYLGDLSSTDPEAPNVLYGNHKRRMSQTKDRRYDIELLEVLSDWWAEGDEEMTLSQALGILSQALCKPEVGGRHLAQQLLSLEVSNALSSKSLNVHSEPPCQIQKISTSSRCSHICRLNIVS